MGVEAAGHWGRRRWATSLASETCVFSTIGAEFVREVEPGEVVRLSDSGLSARQGASCQEPGIVHLRTDLLLSTRFDLRRQPGALNEATAGS